MNRAESLLGALLVAACGAATPMPAAPSPTRATSQLAPNAAKTPQPVDDAALHVNEQAFSRTAPSAAAACVLEGNPWLPELDEAALTLTPGGAEFLKVDDSSAQIEIPIGKASAVFVRISAVGWRVAGHLAASRFSVHPLDIRAREILIPTELSNLRLNEALEGQLLLDLPEQLPVRLAAPPAPLAYTCEEVSIGIVQPFELESALPGTPATRKEVYFTRGEIPISLEPGSATLAWLVDEGERRQALLLARRGAFAQVALLGHVTAVVGWVPQGKIRPLPTSAEGEEWGSGGLGGGGLVGGLKPATKPAPAPELTTYRCDQELALLVSAGTETLQVGSIAPGTTFTARAPSAGLTELVTPSWFKLVQGARFRARESELARCRPEP